jgi:transposase
MEPVRSRKVCGYRARYSTDMSDAEFTVISPLLPARKTRGRKRTDPPGADQIKQGIQDNTRARQAVPSYKGNDVPSWCCKSWR